jgi:hypothetical protein
MQITAPGEYKLPW